MMEVKTARKMKMTKKKMMTTTTESPSPASVSSAVAKREEDHIYGGIYKRSLSSATGDRPSVSSHKRPLREGAYIKRSNPFPKPSRTPKPIVDKYRKIKFYDRKKVMKRMKRAEEELFKLRNLKIEKDEDLELNDSVQPAADAPAEPNSARIQQLEEELARLKDQEIYTKFFPRGTTYISLYPSKSKDFEKEEEKRKELMKEAKRNHLTFLKSQDEFKGAFAGVEDDDDFFAVSGGQ